MVGPHRTTVVSRPAWRNIRETKALGGLHLDWMFCPAAGSHRPRGLALDKGRLNRELRSLRGGVPLNVIERAESDLGDLLARQPHRGQSWLRKRAQFDVVEPNQRYVLRHLQTSLKDRSHRANRRHVVRGE